MGTLNVSETTPKMKMFSPIGNATTPSPRDWRYRWVTIGERGCEPPIAWATAGDIGPSLKRRTPMGAHRKQPHTFDPDIDDAITGEEHRQADGVEMIPSENYTYPEVLAALGSVLTNKYSEGYPGRRYYGGQEYTDRIETIARDRACALFRAEHANVQPLSGSPMNQAVYFGLLSPGDTILAMDLSHGGHLTHGAPVSHMGKVFNFVRYKSAPEAGGAIDFEALRKLARETKPKMV